MQRTKRKKQRTRLNVSFAVLCLPSQARPHLASPGRTKPRPAVPATPCLTQPYHTGHALPDLTCLAKPSHATPCHALPGRTPPHLPRLAIEPRQRECGGHDRYL